MGFSAAFWSVCFMEKPLDGEKMWTLGRCFVLNDVWNYFPGNAGALRWYMMIYYVPIWWYMMIYYVPILQGKTSLEMVGKEWLAWRHWGDEIRIYTYTYHIHIYIYNNPTYPTCRSSSFYECLFGALAPHQLWLTHAGTNAGTVVSQWSPSWIIYRC